MMTHIVVSDEQARVIAESNECVEIRDGEGRRLGYVAHRFTAEDFDIASERLASDEPRHTTQQVLDSLQSLDRQ